MVLFIWLSRWAPPRKQEHPSICSETGRFPLPELLPGNPVTCHPHLYPRHHVVISDCKPTPSDLQAYLHSHSMRQTLLLNLFHDEKSEKRKWSNLPPVSQQVSSGAGIKLWTAWLKKQTMSHWATGAWAGAAWPLTSSSTPGEVGQPHVKVLIFQDHSASINVCLQYPSLFRFENLFSP